VGNGISVGVKRHVLKHLIGYNLLTARTAVLVISGGVIDWINR
jgi:hypothetical protein